MRDALTVDAGRRPLLGGGVGGNVVQLAIVEEQADAGRHQDLEHPAEFLGWRGRAGHRLFDGIHGGHHEDQRAVVERVLDLLLVGVRHTHAGNGARIGTLPPHLRGLIPGGRRVLHLRPDEVVAGIGQRAVDAGIRDVE